ncbi:MAG: leucine-rich repeat domain-containing protein [Ruminococcus sp.]|nr:leucine-rich repeat domain-containing protein [Ruminococcus sp.]
MDKLTTLWLADNYITDISPLKNCKLLSTLDLSGNRIKADSAFDGLEPLYNLQ